MHLYNSLNIVEFVSNAIFFDKNINNNNSKYNNNNNNQSKLLNKSRVKIKRNMYKVYFIYEYLLFCDIYFFVQIFVFNKF